MTHEHEQDASLVLAWLRRAKGYRSTDRVTRATRLVRWRALCALRNLRLAGTVVSAHSLGWCAVEHAAGDIARRAAKTLRGRGHSRGVAAKHARDAVERGAERPRAYAIQSAWHAEISAHRRAVSAAQRAIYEVLEGLHQLRARLIESALRREMIALILLEGPGDLLAYHQMVAAFERKFAGRIAPPRGLSKAAYDQWVTRAVKRAVRLGASDALRERLTRSSRGHVNAAARPTSEPLSRVRVRA